MPVLIRGLCITLFLLLPACAKSEQTGKSDCKSLISHSGFAEVVIPKEGGTQKLAIKVGPSVKWTIRNSAYIDWITILDGDSGVGPGTMTIKLEANPGKLCRTGELTIAGLMRIYGLPIRILQQGTEAVAAENQADPTVPWLIDLEPFSSKNPQPPGKSEFRKATNKR